MIRKTLILAILLGVFCIPAVARTEKGIYVIGEYKSLNSHINEYLCPKDRASDVANVRFNATYGALSKRPVMLSYGSIGSLAVTGLHRLYTSNGTQALIAAGTTYLFVGDDSAGTFTKIGQGYTDGARWQFVTYDDIAIGMNGNENAVKYDGSTSITANTDAHRTAENLVAELGAPFAELDTGTDLDASSWYMYKMAFYDGTSYYYSTARSNAIDTGAAVYNVALTDIPLGPTGTTKRYIYRTLGGANRATVLADTTYYMVSEIADNTTTTLADSVADDDADADAAPTWATAIADGYNVTPPIGAYPTIHQDRLFVSGNSTYKSNVYYSDIQNPEYFDVNDYEEFRPDDGDEITGLQEFLGILTIFKTNSIMKYYTDSAEGTWAVSNPFSFIGCPAPYSIANTPLGLFYLARSGINRFIGQRSELVSDAVTEQIDNILEANIEDCAGYYYNGEYRLAYTDSSTGSTINNKVLIYDLTRDSYTLDTKDVNCFTALASGSDYGDLYMGSSDTDGYVWVDEGESSALFIFKKSELEDGTYDDARSIGTEYEPVLDLAWDCTIDGWTTELQTKDALIDTIDKIDTYIPAAIIDRPDTAGTWTSPSYEIGAGELLLMKWNEDRNNYGDVTFQIRTAATSGGIAAATWSTAVSDPSGSDVTAISALDWIQVRSNLSTTDIDYAPTVDKDNGYLWQIDYVKTSATQESSFLSYWESGWTDLNPKFAGHEKRITEIKVYYIADGGTLTVEYYNDIGDVDASFDIDMSQDVPADVDNDEWDEYRGRAEDKIYVYKPPYNSVDDPEPIGYFWKLKLSEYGTDEWKVSRIEVRYTVEPISE